MCMSVTLDAQTTCLTRATSLKSVRYTMSFKFNLSHRSCLHTVTLCLDQCMEACSLNFMSLSARHWPRRWTALWRQCTVAYIYEWKSIICMEVRLELSVNVSAQARKCYILRLELMNGLTLHSELSSRACLRLRSQDAQQYHCDRDQNRSRQCRDHCQHKHTA